MKKTSHWPISILTSVSAIVNMFVPLVLVRLLPPDQIGIYKIFFLYVMTVPAFTLTAGLSSGLGYWAGQGSRGVRAIQISNGLTFTIGLGASLLCLAATPWVQAWFGWPLLYMVYFSACVLGAVSQNFMEEATIVTGKVWFGAVYQSSTEILRSVVIVLSAWIAHDLDSVLLACAAFSLAKMATSVLLGYKMGLVRFGWDREVIRSIWKYSFPVSMAWLFGAFSKTADQVILSSVLTPAAFAVYAVGCLNVPPLMILEHAVTRVMIPQMSESFATGNSAHAAKNFRDAVEQLAWLLIPAVVGLMVFAQPIIEMLFTSQYSSSAVYLRWYALSYLLLIIPDDALPRSRGEGNWILRTFMLFAPVPLILCYALGMKFAAFGALAGILISRASMKAYALLYVQRSTGWKIKDFLPIGDAMIFVGVSAALGGVCLLLRPASGASLNWFFSCGALFALLYFPCTLLLINLRKRKYSEEEGRTGKVLLYSQHLAVGGIERLVLTLAQSLQKDPRWKVYIFCHDSDEDSDSHSDRTLIAEFLKSGIEVEAFKKKPGLSLMTLYRLVRNIYRNGIDVVHSHDLGTLIYAVLAKFLSLGRIRVVHTQHSFVHIHQFKRYAVYERLFTSFVDVLTVVNESLLAPYIEIGVPKKRIRIVNNGVSFVDSPFSSRSEKLTRRTHLIRLLPAHDRALVHSFASDSWILYLARVHSVKGQRDAARLWSALSPALRQTTSLLLVGPEAEAGERAEVLRAFEGTPDRERVILLDGTHIPQEWLACSDLFLSCSRFEGMPLGPLEAIGSGLPAVLSSIAGHSFLAQVSRQYSPESPNEGGAQIESILKNAAFGTSRYYADLWEKSEWIRKKYSVAAMTEHYAETYSRRPK